MLNRNRLSGQQRHQQQQQQQLEIHRKQAKAERVRKLWVDFEQWLKQPRNEMERERDQLLHQTGRVTSAAVKASRRRIEGAHFHKAREEWQRRLRAVDLRESDWDPMHEAEMKAVEEALGVDDAEGYITDPSPSPPHQIIPIPSSLVDSVNKSIATPGSFVPPLASVSAPTLSATPSTSATAPPLTVASRTSSTSSYECVRPEDFHSEDDEELTPDSDYSSFSSTISTIISEEDEVVGPVTEYMFTQALESSGFTGLPQETLNDKGPVIARANVSAPPKLAENASRGGPPLAPPPKRPPDVNVKPSPPQAPQPPPVSKTNSAGSNNSPSPQTLPPSTSASKSQASSSKPSRIHYPLVAPSLSDLSDYDEVGDDAETGSKRLSPSLVAQFEAQFEARKLQIRIDKIREFHKLACDSDAELCVNLAQGRKSKTLTRQIENRLVEEHYQRTVALRERMEKERKEQVKQEQRRMRDEFSRRNTSNTSIFGSGHHHQPNGGPTRQGQGRFPVGSQESDTDPEDEMKQKLEKMKQEQMALQAKYASTEATKAPTTTTTTTTTLGRKRAGTLTADNAPAIRGPAGINDKRFEESDHGSTPKPSGSAWSSIKSASSSSSSNGRNILNNQNQNQQHAPSSSSSSKKGGASLFDFSSSNEPASIGVSPSSSTSSYVDVDSVDREADNEDEDEEEKENTGFWSYLTSGQKKKAAQQQPSLPPAPSPWNFSGPQPRIPQKPVTGKSRLGIVTSAWDDGFEGEEKDAVVVDGSDAVVGKELVEKEVESLEKTPVIPSAPAPNVSNKKQTKKQRMAGKKAAVPTPTKAESSNVQQQPAQVQQKGGQAKSAPVSVPNKGRKSSLVDGDDLSSTPRPSVLKRLQAQLANEEAGMEHDDDTPTTPRPAVAASKKLMPGNNPWARKGAASSALSNSGFDDAEDDDDDDAADLMDAVRPVVVNGKKSGDAPQVPGSWKWGENKAPPAAATATATRKGAAGRQSAASAALTNGVEPETTKKRGKKAVNGQRSAWGVKRTTVEEVPDDEGDDVISGTQSESLPYNSRSILEHRDAEEVVEQPRILEPKPSKPRTMYDNIIQYEAAAPADVEDLRDGLDWSEERLTSALARMAQESAEMDRRVNSLGTPAVSANGVNGTNGVANVSASSVSMSKPVVVAEQNMSVPGPKKVRWQQPSTINGLDAAAPSQSQQAFVNRMVSRSYDDEAFSPMATAANNAFPALHFGSYGGQTNGLASGVWPPANGQYGNPFAPDAESDDDDLSRTARNLFETIHISASSQQRNRPGFAAA